MQSTSKPCRPYRSTSSRVVSSPSPHLVWAWSSARSGSSLALITSSMPEAWQRGGSKWCPCREKPEACGGGGTLRRRVRQCRRQHAGRILAHRVAVRGHDELDGQRGERLQRSRDIRRRHPFRQPAWWADAERLALAAEERVAGEDSLRARQPE